MPPEGTGGTIPLRRQVTDRVMTLTLDNPPDNRLTPATLGCLDGFLDQLQDTAVDALLITGRGRTFSKGFDIDAVSAERDQRRLRTMLVESNAVFSRLARAEKPVIAAINGACLGGGLELALCCHFRLCITGARLGLPEVWGGMVPGLGGLHRLGRLVGQAKALELVALGDLVTGDQALRLNLVNRLYPKGEFSAQVNGFLKALLTAEPMVLREIIRLAQCNGLSNEDCLREGMESFARVAPWMRD